MNQRPNSSINSRLGFNSKMTWSERGFRGRFSSSENRSRFPSANRMEPHQLTNSQKNDPEVLNKKLKNFTGKRYFNEIITKTFKNSPNRDGAVWKHATQRLGVKRKSPSRLSSDFISLNTSGLPSPKQRKLALNSNGKSIPVIEISSSEDEALSSEDVPAPPCTESKFGSIPYTLEEAERLFMSDGISMEIRDFFVRNRQKDGFLRKKHQLRTALEKAINRTMDQGSFLVLVGSSSNGFGRLKSDADFCLVLDEKLESIGKRSRVMKTLYSLRDLLRRAPFVRDMQVIPATVPILKFVDSFSGMECDININNLTGIRNTELMKRYGMLDPRVQPLALVIKEWAHQRKINDASQGTLSSYSLVLMVIHFLQCGVRPSVLPSIQSKHPDLFKMTTPVSQVEKVADGVNCYRSSNRLTLFQLLAKFFHYFAEEFDFNRIMSVRLGKVLKVSETRSSWAKEWKKPIKIEEPFDHSNTARAVHNVVVAERIFRQFKTASRTLRRHKTLQSILPSLNFHEDTVVIEDD